MEGVFGGGLKKEGNVCITVPDFHRERAESLVLMQMKSLY